MAYIFEDGSAILKYPTITKMHNAIFAEVVSNTCCKKRFLSELNAARQAKKYINAQNKINAMQLKYEKVWNGANWGSLFRKKRMRMEIREMIAS